ncbi:MAG TPA: hypothetical protein VNA20_07405 [Frankiaceae bacterium]|nr:hypothetical protein [Frankiaceae bacterium]
MTESTHTGDPVEVGVETPEADAVEQAQGAGALPVRTRDLPDDVPEADAVEQAQGTDGAATPRHVRSIPDDVPEADALEQAYEVELDDDYRG